MRTAGFCVVTALVVGCGAGPVPAPDRPASSVRDAESTVAADDAPRLSLLGGHVSIVVDPSWSGDVAHDRSGGAVVESRVALEPADAPGLFAFPRFQMTIQELHRRTGGDVMADARHVFRDDWELEPEPDPSGRIAWVRGDRRPWNGQVPFVVLGALVVLEDGFVQRVLFRIAADVPLSERPEYARRARAIVRAMRMGEPLSDDAGTHRIPGGLTIDVPPRVRFTCGATECAARQLAEVGAPPSGLLSLHFGPSPRVALPPPSGASERHDTLLGRPVVWHVNHGDMRVLRTGVQIDRELEMTILVQAMDETQERAWMDIVHSLRRPPS